MEPYNTAKMGGGFLRYIWPKPGAGDQPKLSYSEMIPGTEMWIGTGVYIDNVDARRATIHDTISRSVDKTLALVFGIVIAALVLVVLPLSTMIFLSIVRPLRETTKAAQDVARNRLDVIVTPVGKDKITLLEHALKIMITTLRDNIQEIEGSRSEAQHKAKLAEEAAAQAADEARQKAEAARCEGMLDAANRLEEIVHGLTASSEELSSQAEQINRGYDYHRERIAETATAIEEMNSTVSKVARNASYASQCADSSRAKALEGRTIVSNSPEAMHKLSDLSSELRDNMGLLGEKAYNIGQVMGVINDIADQTNLLALNAAIEAARVGEAGRGFAVMADEVRKLAEKTMAATNEVREAITGIQDVSKGAQTFAEQAADAIVRASDLASRSDEKLSEIVSLSDETASQVTSIATATEEISSSVGDVNRIASENAEAMHQATQATRNMARQADMLLQLVEELKKEGGNTCGWRNDSASPWLPPPSIIIDSSAQYGSLRQKLPSALTFTMPSTRTSRARNTGKYDKLYLLVKNPGKDLFAKSPSSGRRLIASLRRVHASDDLGAMHGDAVHLFDDLCCSPRWRRTAPRPP